MPKLWLSLIILLLGLSSCQVVELKQEDFPGEVEFSDVKNEWGSPVSVYSNCFYILDLGPVIEASVDKLGKAAAPYGGNITGAEISTEFHWLDVIFRLLQYPLFGTRTVTLEGKKVMDKLE